MKSFLALLKLQLLSRYANLKPKNLKALGTLEELRSGEVGASLEELFLELTDDGGETA